MQEQELKTKICDAASDYKMGCNNSGFANEYGGIDELRKCLFVLVNEWEDEADEEIM